jgi:hypothetical protein
MSDDKDKVFKKDADQLLFDDTEKVLFRSMIAEGVILNDSIQKDKI